jgi:hypothetical protein
VFHAKTLPGLESAPVCRQAGRTSKDKKEREEKQKYRIKEERIWEFGNYK